MGWREDRAIHKTFAVGYPAELTPEAFVRVETLAVRTGGGVACDAAKELCAFVVAALDARPDFAMEGERAVLREDAAQEELSCQRSGLPRARRLRPAPALARAGPRNRSAGVLAPLADGEGQVPHCARFWERGLGVAAQVP